MLCHVYHMIEHVVYQHRYSISTSHWTHRVHSIKRGLCRKIEIRFYCKKSTLSLVRLFILMFIYRVFISEKIKLHTELKEIEVKYDTVCK